MIKPKDVHAPDVTLRKYFWTFFQQKQWSSQHTWRLQKSLTLDNN